MAYSRRWTPEEIGALVATEAAKTGADPLVLLAVIDVESGFNNLAVGDGGTSFGLFQHHIGGAGGTTKESAQRYLDPAMSIPERARAFASARTGADAAAVQRPANAAEYARKVEKRLTALRRAAQSSSGSTSGASGGSAIKQVIGPLDGPEADHMDHVHVAGHSATNNKKDPTRDWVAQRAKAHRLTKTSGDRATKHTANGNVSDHWNGQKATWADDYGGAMSDMRAFNQEMRGYVGSTPSGSSMVRTGAVTSILAIPGVSSALASAAGTVLRGGQAAAGAAGDAAGAVAGMASDVAGVISDAVENLLKGGFRYGLVIAVVLLGGLLVLVGVTRTFGAGLGGSS